jgi:hypothetical protein
VRRATRRRRAVPALFEALAGLCRDDHDGDVRRSIAVHAPSSLLQLPGLHDEDDLEPLRLRTAGATTEWMMREFAGVRQALGTSSPILL